MKRKTYAALSLTGPRWDAACVVLFSLLLFFFMHVWTEPFSVGAAFVALALCLGRTPWRLGRERFCVPLLGFLAFALLYGLAAIYSPFGGSAVRSFSGALPAFALGAVILLRAEQRHIPGLLWGVAAVCAAVSLLCTSYACEGPLSAACTWLMEAFGQEDFAGALESTIGRVTGLYNDANVSGSILALGTLVALYLVQSGKGWRERLPACLLMGISAMGILLSVSRGAILCFGISLLLWLLAAGRGQRIRLFLLFAVSAAAVLAASVPAMAAVAPGAIWPNLLAVASGGAAFLLDWAIGERVTAILEGHLKAAVAALAALALVGGIVAAAALTLTGPYEFKGNAYLYRTASLSPGDYTLSTEWEQGEGVGSWVGIYSRSYEESLTNQRTFLYTGKVEEASFTVPEGSLRVYFHIRGSDGSVLRSAVLSDGTELPLRYRLLPEGIARRLQEGLFSSNSYLLRLQYDKDAWKLFLQRPLFGHGLGSTDNLYPAVQPFYYTSRYAHNHILQVMADMGIIGLASFLTFLGGVLWLLAKQLRKGTDPLAAMLLACWVMMNTHSLMEINFSLQAYQCVAFVLLLLPVVLYGRPLAEKAAKACGAAVCVVMWLYLAVYGGLLGLRQSVQRESNTLRATSMDELMEALDSYAKRDVFDPAPYQLEYVATAAQDTEGRYYLKMMEYVDKLRTSGSYPACSGLLEYYYLQVGDFRGLFACSRECLAQRASYADVWNGQLEFYRSAVLPAMGAERADEFVEEVLAFQALLEEINRTHLEEIILTDENQSFIELVSTVAFKGLPASVLYEQLISKTE